MLILLVTTNKQTNGQATGEHRCPGFSTLLRPNKWERIVGPEVCERVKTVKTTE